MPAKDGEPIFTDRGPKGGVGNSETGFGGQAEDADFSVVTIVVHFVRRLTGLFECVGRRERRHYLSDTDGLVRVPGLAVVRKVRTLNGL